MVTFPTTSSKVKNWEFVSCLQAIRENNQCLCYLLFYVVTTFVNVQEGFSLITSKLHRFCVCHFMDMTQFLTPRSPFFLGGGGDEAVDWNKHL